MIERSCSTCMWWFGLPGDEEHGACRRYPPVVFPISSQVAVIGGRPSTGGQMTISPITVSAFWCGEWRDTFEES